MPEFKFEATGLAELQKNLAELPAKLSQNILRGAIRAASVPVRNAAQRNAPVLSQPDRRRIAGALRKSIRVRGVRIKGGVVTGGVAAGDKVSVGRGKNKIAADAFYAMWVEFGHLVRVRGGKLRGGTRFKAAQRETLNRQGARRVPGRHFLRDAGRSAGDAAVSAFAGYLRQRMEGARSL